MRNIFKFNSPALMQASSKIIFKAADIVIHAACANPPLAAQPRVAQWYA